MQEIKQEVIKLSHLYKMAEEQLYLVSLNNTWVRWKNDIILLSVKSKWDGYPDIKYQNINI